MFHYGSTLMRHNTDDLRDRHVDRVAVDVETSTESLVHAVHGRLVSQGAHCNIAFVREQVNLITRNGQLKVKASEIAARLLSSLRRS